MGKFNKLLGLATLAGATAAAMNYLKKKDMPAEEAADAEPETPDTFDEDLKALFDDFDSDSEEGAEADEEDIEIEYINDRDEKMAVIKDDLQEILDLVKGDLVNVFANMKEGFGGASKVVKEKAENVDMDDLKTKAVEFSGIAAGKLAEAFELASVKLNELKEKAADTEVGQKAQEAAAEAEQAMKEAMEKIMEEAQAAVEKIREAAAQGEATSAAESDEESEQAEAAAEPEQAEKAAAEPEQAESSESAKAAE